MKSIKKILCALDLSSHSARVAEHAVAVAKAFDAEILVVYAAPPLSQYAGFEVPAKDIDMFVGEIVSGAEKSMEEFIPAHFPGIKAEGKVLVGYASEEITRQAKEWGADLIIMGTHGRKGIDRIIFGSVAEKVVISAEVPVMTIRPESES